MPRAIFLALGALAGAALFQFAVMPLLVTHGGDVTVPDVVGMKVDEAERLLQGAGLAGVREAERVNREWPVHTVLEQDPPPGLRTVAGREIGLVVSLGRGEATIPDLVGESLRHAELVLVREGVGVGQLSYVTSDVKAGHVVGMMPGPGARIPQGQPVDLLLSAGPRRAVYLLPDFSGADAEALARALRRLGFKVEVIYPLGAVDARGRVATQVPPPGHRVEPGDELKLLVGEG
jgi:serine/threonine-protein kinase